MEFHRREFEERKNEGDEATEGNVTDINSDRK